MVISISSSSLFSPPRFTLFHASFLLSSRDTCCCCLQKSEKKRDIIDEMARRKMFLPTESVEVAESAIDSNEEVFETQGLFFFST
jgi:hypothetical protein